MKIGFLGLGLMGFPMAENVLSKMQPEKLIIYNRSSEKSKKFRMDHEEGVTVVSSPVEVADLCDVAILVLTDDQANDEVMASLLKTVNKNLTIINMSTITPQKSIELYNSATKKGFNYIEAPVAGTTGPAKQGTLKIYTGGSKKVNDDMQSLLLTMGDKVFYMGDIGKASTVKLLINSNLAVYMSILSETLQAAEKLGIGSEKFLEIINSGPLASVASKGKGPNIIKGNFSVAFPFQHMLKDVTYSLSLLDSKKLPLIDLVKKQYESGLNLEKNKDFSAIYDYYAQLYN